MRGVCLSATRRKTPERSVRRHRVRPALSAHRGPASGGDFAPGVLRVDGVGQVAKRLAPLHRALDQSKIDRRGLSVVVGRAGEAPMFLVAADEPLVPLRPQRF